jgi:LPPG:FO 2-phospho-L-lactate transferase
VIVALAGGVGGAKLASGLAAVLPPDELLIVVNTGDDFEHFGLHISPDLDTVMYTLAGRANSELGWGLAGETWHCMEALEQVGAETWFRLGDRDLGTHLARTHRLRRGESLSAVTSALCRSYGVAARIAPMSDGDVRTFVHTREGELAFQDYFVRRRCEPQVTAIEYRDAERAAPAGAFARALDSADLEAVIICPSNPLLSIGPMLALPGIRDRLASLRVPRIAVSPIIRGEAVKGPAAKILRELGKEASPMSVAQIYGNAINAMLVDDDDAQQIGQLGEMGIVATHAPTLMKSAADRERVARTVLQFAQSLRERRVTV